MIGWLHLLMERFPRFSIYLPVSFAGGAIYFPAFSSGEGAMGASLQILSSCLVGELVLGLSWGPGPARAAAILYGVLAVATEGVVRPGTHAWAVGTFLTLSAAVLYLITRRRPAFLLWTVFAIAAAAAIVWSPAGASLPVLLLLLDFWAGFRPGDRARFYLPHVVTALGAGVGIFFQAGPVLDRFIQAPVSFIGGVTASVSRVAWLACWPPSLSAYHPPLDGGDAPWIIVSLGMLVGAGFLVWRAPREPITAGILWFAVLQVLTQSLGDGTIAEHRALLPVVGLAIAFGGLVRIVGSPGFDFRPSLRFVFGLLAALVIVGQGAGADLRVGLWLNGSHIWEDAARHYPDRPEPWLILARWHEDRRDGENTITDYRKAVSLRPSDPGLHFLLATTFHRLNRIDEAIASYADALRIDPNSAPANYGLGEAYAQKGEVEKAAAQYLAALRIQPSFLEAALALAATHAQQGRPDQAESDLRQAALVRPQEPRLYTALGILYGSQGRWLAATGVLQVAAQEAPTNPEVHLLLGNALTAVGRNAEAIEAYQISLRLDPRNITGLFNLARAEDAAGHAAEANRRYRDFLARLSKDQDPQTEPFRKIALERSRVLSASSP